MKTKRDLLSITDLSRRDILDVLHTAAMLKKARRRRNSRKLPLRGKTLVMVFEKPSLRTHASFDIGMFELGGHALYLGPEHIGLGTREPVAHAAPVLSRMGAVIMARVFRHATLEELARHASVPVINGLSDLEHPCQILADLMTIVEHKKRLTGISIAFIGDGENNVTHSLALASGLLGMHLTVASPSGYAMRPEIAARASALAKKYGGSVREVRNPREAVKGADVVYTDTWVSMGDEREKARRLKAFRPFQVNEALMRLAKSDAVFMHDMPAHIGQEVADAVFGGRQSVVFDQAENRLHAQKGLLVFLLKKAAK